MKPFNTIPQLKLLMDAIDYAILYEKKESDTAKFALLKSDVANEYHVLLALEQQKKKHDKINCVFMYCTQTPRCEGTCDMNKIGGDDE